MSEYCLHFLWDPEVSHCVHSYAFSSPLLRDVFLQGVEESEKSVDGTVHFVSHPGYAWVDGKLVEVNQKLRTKASLHERYLFWEDEMSSRSIPETVSFDTVDEAACYELGVLSGLGHKNAILVPGPNFRIIRSYDLDWLPPEVAQAYAELIHAKQELDDNIIGNEEGQWVEIGWKIEHDIQQLIISRNVSQNETFKTL